MCIKKNGNIEKEREDYSFSKNISRLKFLMKYFAGFRGLINNYTIAINLCQKLLIKNLYDVLIVTICSVDCPERKKKSWSNL